MLTNNCEALIRSQIRLGTGGRIHLRLTKKFQRLVTWEQTISVVWLHLIWKDIQSWDIHIKTSITSPRENILWLLQLTRMSFRKFCKKSSRLRLWNLSWSVSRFHDKNSIIKICLPIVKEHYSNGKCVPSKNYLSGFWRKLSSYHYPARSDNCQPHQTPIWQQHISLVE